jgi:hemerythrin superfamily protein
MKNNTPDAIDMLKADHREAEKLFKKCDALKGSGEIKEKREVVRQVCAALLIHMQIEEEIFYPAAREAIDDDELLDEATVEHNGAKELIHELSGTHDETMFDAKTKVLKEQIEHHVEEEEENLFPQLRKSHLDLMALGERLAKEKAQLERTHNMAPA